MIIVLGSEGQLGSAVVEAGKKAKIHTLGFSHNQCDIMDPNALRAVLRPHMTDIRREEAFVVNCVGYTDVLRAEHDITSCFDLNAQGAYNVAMATYDYDMFLIHISTDYVFNGEVAGGYLPHSQTNPINAYGLSKLASEKIVAFRAPRYKIIRTSALFGPTENRSKGTTIKRALIALKNKETSYFTDEGSVSPSYAPHVAKTIVKLIEDKEMSLVKHPDDMQNIFHLVNEGQTTWYKLIKEAAQYYPYLHLGLKASGINYSTDVRRPLHSALINDLEYYKLPPWQDAVKEYIGKCFS